MMWSRSRVRERFRAEASRCSVPPRVPSCEGASASGREGTVAGRTRPRPSRWSSEKQPGREEGPLCEDGVPSSAEARGHNRHRRRRTGGSVRDARAATATVRDFPGSCAARIARPRGAMGRERQPRASAALRRSRGAVRRNRGTPAMSSASPSPANRAASRVGSASDRGRRTRPSSAARAARDRAGGASPAGSRRGLRA
jgi:hypothetical protein